MEPSVTSAVNPEGVLGTALSFIDSEAYDKKWNTVHWYALYTKSRHEKFVSRELEKKGIETFLPLRRVMHRWSDRKKMIEEPLFKGYLFVHTPLCHRFPILNTVGAVCFVGRASAEPTEVPEQDILAVRRFVNEEIQIDPFPYLKVGDRVYVRSGPFKGVEGFIDRKDKHCRLVISLHLLMQSISIQIDEACVELV
jgi:transcription antitermination factor NusG